MAPEEQMTIISGYLDFPDLDRTDLLAALADLTERSRQDDGCVEYWWAEDLGRPMRFRFFECWESAAHLDAHRAQPYEAEFLDRYVARCGGAGATICDVAHRRPAG